MFTCCGSLCKNDWPLSLGDGDGAGTYTFDESVIVVGGACTGCALGANILKALCFKGNCELKEGIGVGGSIELLLLVCRSCFSKITVGIGTVGIDIEATEGEIVVVGILSFISLEISGDVEGFASVDCTALAIFLNFLCKYVPSDSSHLCSSGSTAGVVLTGERGFT